METRALAYDGRLGARGARPAPPSPSWRVAAQPVRDGMWAARRRFYRLLAADRPEWWVLPLRLEPGNPRLRPRGEQCGVAFWLHDAVTGDAEEGPGRAHPAGPGGSAYEWTRATLPASTILRAEVVHPPWAPQEPRRARRRPRRLAAGETRGDSCRRPEGVEGAARTWRRWAHGDRPRGTCWWPRGAAPAHAHHRNARAAERLGIGGSFGVAGER